MARKNTETVSAPTAAEGGVNKIDQKIREASEASAREEAVKQENLLKEYHVSIDQFIASTGAEKAQQKKMRDMLTKPEIRDQIVTIAARDTKKENLPKIFQVAIEQADEKERQIKTLNERKNYWVGKLSHLTSTLETSAEKRAEAEKQIKRLETQAKNLQNKKLEISLFPETPTFAKKLAEKRATKRALEKEKTKVLSEIQKKKLGLYARTQVPEESLEEIPESAVELFEEDLEEIPESAVIPEVFIPKYEEAKTPAEDTEFEKGFETVRRAPSKTEQELEAEPEYDINGQSDKEPAVAPRVMEKTTPGFKKPAPKDENQRARFMPIVTSEQLGQESESLLVPVDERQKMWFETMDPEYKKFLEELIRSGEMEKIEKMAMNKSDVWVKRGDGTFQKGKVRFSAELGAIPRPHSRDLKVIFEDPINGVSNKNVSYRDFIKWQKEANESHPTETSPEPKDENQRARFMPVVTSEQLGQKAPAPSDKTEMRGFGDWIAGGQKPGQMEQTIEDRAQEIMDEKAEAGEPFSFISAKEQAIAEGLGDMKRELGINRPKDETEETDYVAPQPESEERYFGKGQVELLNNVWNSYGSPDAARSSLLSFGVPKNILEKYPSPEQLWMFLEKPSFWARINGDAASTREALNNFVESAHNEPSNEAVRNALVNKDRSASRIATPSRKAKEAGVQENRTPYRTEPTDESQRAIEMPIVAAQQESRFKDGMPGFGDFIADSDAKVKHDIEVRAAMSGYGNTKEADQGEQSDETTDATLEKFFAEHPMTNLTQEDYLDAFHDASIWQQEGAEATLHDSLRKFGLGSLIEENVSVADLYDIMKTPSFMQRLTGKAGKVENAMNDFYKVYATTKGGQFTGTGFNRLNDEKNAPNFFRNT
jgi:hypothetical protein